MALCITVQVVTIDSVSYQILSPSLTQTIDNCTAYVLETAPEYIAEAGFFTGVTLNDVVDVSWMIAGVWAIAFGFKQLYRVFPF